MALRLNLNKRPRSSCHSSSNLIKLTSSKQAPAKLKLLILITASHWGVSNSNKTYGEKKRILCAASRMIAYDNGYSTEFATNTIQTWDIKIKENILKGMHFSNIGENSTSKCIAETSTIESANLGYLHDLY